MGLFSKNLLKVIEWQNESKDLIAYRYDVPDRFAIMKNSQLTVREAQMAAFIMEGKLADVFKPGRYKLDDIRNIPLLTQLFSWKYGFETPYTGDIYFFNTIQFTNQKWGTSNPVMMRDHDFGVIRIRAFGVYSYRVVDPAKVVRELSGTKKELRTTDVNEYFKKLMVSKLSDSIAESRLPALDLAMHYDELSDLAKTKMAVDFANFGLELTSLYIENVSLPEEVEKVLDQRTQLGVLSGKMNEYTQFQSTQAMRDAAKNTGGVSGLGIGMGAGIGMGNMFMNSMNKSFNNDNNNTAQAQNSTDKTKCSKCNALIDKNAKFCPSCGNKNGFDCPKCGKPINSNAKFCPECGTNISNRTCRKCNKEVSTGSAFCPFCGEKM